jgi:hypothetical protein
MADFASWYRREDYQRIRQIMDDGDEFPVSFDQWEINAQRGIARSAALGVTLETVIFDPDEFIAFCDSEKIPRDSKARAMFGVRRGFAKRMN